MPGDSLGGAAVTVAAMNEVLSSADVLRIAALSKVGVEAAEIERLRIDLGAVLSYMDVLRGMPEPALEGSTSETANRLGRDEPGPSRRHA